MLRSHIRLTQLQIEADGAEGLTSSTLCTLHSELSLHLEAASLETPLLQALPRQ